MITSQFELNNKFVLLNEIGSDIDYGDFINFYLTLPII